MLGHIAVFLLISGNFQARTDAPVFGVNQSVAAFTVDLAFERDEVESIPANPEPAITQPKDAPVVIREKPVRKKTQATPRPPKSEATASQPSEGDATSTTQHAAPAYASNPPPKYPESARRAQQEGVVILLVTVDREGSPIHVHISETSGSIALDEAAVSAVEEWSFRPGMVNGQPTETTVEVPIRFSLSAQS